MTERAAAGMIAAAPTIAPAFALAPALAMAPALVIARALVMAAGLTSALALGGREAAAQDAPLVVGTWMPVERSLPNPLPLTDTALAAQEPTPPCVPPGMPALLDTRAAVEITQRAETLRIRYSEWGDATRTVYMNPRSGPATQKPSPLGVSFGRWEGQTLAIFTTYIASPYFDRAGTPQSAAVTVLERYTPSADRARLEWRATVTDAATFKTPVVLTGSMAASGTSLAGSTAPAGGTAPAESSTAATGGAASAAARAAAATGANGDAAAPSAASAGPLVASGCVG